MVGNWYQVPLSTVHFYKETKYSDSHIQVGIEDLDCSLNLENCFIVDEDLFAAIMKGCIIDLSATIEYIKEENK